MRKQLQIQLNRIMHQLRYADPLLLGYMPQRHLLRGGQLKAAGLRLALGPVRRTEIIDLPQDILAQNCWHGATPLSIVVDKTPFPRLGLSCCQAKTALLRPREWVFSSLTFFGRIRPYLVDRPVYRVSYCLSDAPGRTNSVDNLADVRLPDTKAFCYRNDCNFTPDHLGSNFIRFHAHCYHQRLFSKFLIST